jgi:hypothetical protein
MVFFTACLSCVPLRAAGCEGDALAAAACPQDCDRNGRDDACEIDEHPEADCNRNGLLDGCETENDRNGNGFPDDCDVQTGRSADCNRNTVPDEVEAEVVHRFQVAALQHPFALVAGAADMDRDGDLDLISSVTLPDCNPRRGAAIIFNLGGFAFQVGPPAVLGDVISCLLIADFDQDGDVDLVAAHSDGRREDPRVTPLFNEGRGRLVPGEGIAISFLPLPASRAIDIDLDADPDLVLLGGGSPQEAELALYRNDGRGSFVAGARLSGAEMKMASAPLGLTAADLDGDGDLDFAAAAFGSGRIAGITAEGPASLRAATLIELDRPVGQIDAADLDSDGDPDLAAATQVRDGDLERLVIGFLHVLENRGAAGFHERPAIDLGARIERLLFADLDRDGDLDMTGTHASRYYASLYVWTNPGDGRLQARARVAGPGRAAPIQAADLDGDGRLDILLADPDRTAFLWAVAGQIAGPPSILPHGQDVGSAAFTDLDGDGDTDVATAGAFQVGLLANDGGRLFTPRGRVPIGSDPAAIATGDFDADGRPDLATLNSIGGNISALINRGAWMFASPRNHAGPEEPRRLRAADLDGDGGADLVVTAFSEPVVLLLMSRSDGSFAPPVPVSATGPIYDAVAVDLDGDFDLDLATTQQLGPAGGAIATFRNAGQGRLSAAASYPEDQPRSLAAGDLDGDGDQDLAFGNAAWGVSLRSNLGAGDLGPPVEIRRDTCSDGVQIVDADGDGDLEHFSVALNRGDGAFTESRRAPLLLTEWFQLLDLDGDGDREVLGLTYEGGEGFQNGGSDLIVLEDQSGPLSRDEDRDGVPDECREPPAISFRRGDAVPDGKLDITDAVAVLRGLFQGGTLACRDAADANDDGRIELTDAVVILRRLFAGGAPLPEPTACGRDPTLDALDCEAFGPCR